jgi:hypothetical protein
VDRDGEAEPRVLARGVVAHLGVEALTEPGELDDLVELAVGLLLAHAEDRGVEEEVLAAGELGVEAGAGGDQAGDPAAGQYRPLVRLHHAADHLEQGALARAVEPHQADRLTLLDGERDPVDGLEVGAGLLAAHLGDRHLLDGPVVAQLERLGDVVENDRGGHLVTTVPGSGTRAG